MKSHFYLILLALALAVYTKADEVKIINLKYSPSDFSVMEKNGLIYIESDSQSFVLKSDTAAPALPYIGINVVVDNNCDYLNHRIDTREVLILENVKLSRNPQSVPSNCTVFQTLINNNIKYDLYEYPENNVEYAGTHIIGGNKILCFSICPFRYDTSRQNLFLKTNIILRISLSRATPQKLSYERKELVKDIVYNKEDLMSQDSSPKQRLRFNASSSSNMPYEYLIVTRDSLKDVFQHLADWKTQKGVPTKVITVDSIYANSTETRPQLKIKKALMDYYEGSNHALKYVLLAGDHEIVPAEYCRVTMSFIQNGMVVTERPEVPSDIFYSSFKSLNWDTNNDGFSGEVIDNVDIAHDIIATRLSVSSVTDAQNQVNRIIKYERNPSIDNWEDNILMCGTTLNEKHYDYPEGRMSDTHYKSEKIYKKYIQDFWPSVQKYKFYDTGTSFAGGDLYHFRVNNLQEQISNGYSVIYLVAHGNPDSWKMEWIDNPPFQLYYTSDALSASNPRRSIVITSACHTNAFDVEQTSLSEGFMRNPNAGILGYYGSSHYGWHYSDSIRENNSDIFNGELMKRLLQDGKHQLGRAVYDSKSVFLNNANSNNAFRWLLFTLNALCDPEMPVYISEPQTFASVSISYSNNTLNVSTGVPDCRICVMSRNDRGISYYETVDNTNDETFILGLDTYNICIAKDGYIPYLAVVGNPVYLQNENICSDIIIKSNQTFIGYDVTTVKSPGEVIISNGTTKIINNGNVTITKGFEVENGAVFEITN